MIRVNQQSKRTKKKKNLKKKNLIASTKSRVLNNTKIYQLKVERQEKLKEKQPKIWERKRERVRDR